MAGAKPGVHVMVLRSVVVPKLLEEGSKFVKWDDDSMQAIPVTLKVDPQGFFLFWRDQNNETEMLDISLIRDTRTGRQAKTPNNAKLQCQVNMGPQEVPLEDKTLTVVYGTDFVNMNYLNFCSSNKDVVKDWSDKLLNMAYNLLALNSSTFMFLEKAYTKLSLLADRDGKIPVKNIVKLFAQNREDKKKVEKALDAAELQFGKNDFLLAGKFTFEDFIRFYKHLTKRSEIEKIFEQYTGPKNKTQMTVDQLVKFLNNVQRDPRLNEILYPYANSAKAKELIKLYEPNKTFAKQDCLSVDGFLRYLMSDDNVIVSPEKFDVNEDMDQPLSHYFINSSHNTYLTGHQLTGKASVEIYRQALLSGCRCVELDCWNGKTSEEEPIITHGFTVVTDISLKEVLEAIADSAFKTSSYPLILSFENHCSQKQQAKMANYCRKLFGDSLLYEPFPSCPLAPGAPLPSPHQLRGKILIKNKKKHHHRSVEPTVQPIAEEGEAPVVKVAKLQKSDSKDSQASDNASVDNEAVNSSSNGGVDDLDLSSDTDEEGVVLPEEELYSKDEKAELDTSSKESEAGAEMSALVNYIQPVHFHSFEAAEKKGRSYEVSSFVETQATNLLKIHPVEFVNYNKRQLSRIYPKGTRVDSSNYMPQVFWNAGCQLVALNYQTLDLAMQLNLGIFEFNGRSGYLLKPDFMRRHDRRFDPFAESTVDGIIAGNLSIQIISGQFLTDKRVGTYVEVESYGLPADTVRKRFKTKTVPNNGINPLYDEEPFVFKKVVLPDLACLRIVVSEEGGKTIGSRVLPVVGLRPGYRHINLRNEMGQPLTLPSLFVYINVKDYVPDQFSELADALTNPIKYQSDLEKRTQQLSALTDDFTEDDTHNLERKRASIPHGPDRTISDDVSSFPVDIGGESTESNTNPILGSSPPNTSGKPLVRQNTNKQLMKRVESIKNPYGVRSSTTDSSDVMQLAPLEIPESMVKADTVEKICESKAVHAVIVKLEKELQALRKKHDKARHKEEEHPNEGKSLKKRWSRSSTSESQLCAKGNGETSSAPESSAKSPAQTFMSATLAALSRAHTQQEQDLQEKHHLCLYASIEKTMAQMHAAQVKALQDLQKEEVAAVKKRLDDQRTEEIKSLKKKHKDKNELERMKRELQTRCVTQAVIEIQKLNDLFEVKLKELQRDQEEVRARTQAEKEAKLEKLQDSYQEAMAKFEATHL